MQKHWLAALVAVFALAGSTQAQTGQSFNTTLDTLIGSGTNAGGITLGDKRYFDFRFSSTGDAPLDANEVDVALTSTADQNQYQLRFAFARDPLDSNAGQTTDVVIGYRIEVLGQQFIDRVGLAFDASVAGTSGGDAASVIETIRTAAPELSPSFPGQSQVEISVFNDGTGGLPDNGEFSLVVHPTRTLEFEKDILVSSRPGGGRVVINTVDNVVNQVPEPGAGVLVAAAGALLLTRRRRA